MTKSRNELVRNLSGSMNNCHSQPSLLEILIQLIRKLEPEEIARKIQQFDPETCTQVFLSELKPVLPTPEQVPLLLSVIRAYSLPSSIRLGN
jgi:hypothetical protein